MELWINITYNNGYMTLIFVPGSVRGLLNLHYMRWHDFSYMSFKCKLFIFWYSFLVVICDCDTDSFYFYSPMHNIAGFLFTHMAKGFILGRSSIFSKVCWLNFWLVCQVLFVNSWIEKWWILQQWVSAFYTTSKLLFNKCGKFMVW